jgi:hypothetical protein
VVRGFGSLIGILFLVGLIIKFIWWILGATALVALFFVARSVYRAERARREEQAKLHAQIAARADEQHRWILAGDGRGIYGQYPVANLNRPAAPPFLIRDRQ